MKINKSQKTTTVFDIAMDAADVKDLLAEALRAKVGVPVGHPGVTVGIDIAVDAAGAITVSASIAVEASAVIASDEGARAPVDGQGPALSADAGAASPEVELPSADQNAAAPIADAPAADGPVPPVTPVLTPGFLRAS